MNFETYFLLIRLKYPRFWYKTAEYYFISGYTPDAAVFDYTNWYMTP